MSAKGTDRRDRVIELIEDFARAAAPVNFAAKLDMPNVREALPAAIGQAEDALNKWNSDVIGFMHSDGMAFKQESRNACRAAINMIRSVQGAAQEIRNKSAESERHVVQMIDAVDRYQKEIREILLAIPTEPSPQLIGAKSPYTAYQLIKSELQRAKKRVHYFDRYLDSSYFDLYMRKLPRDIEVKLVTTKGKLGRYGVADMISQARLTPQEFPNFGLYELSETEFHDRNMRVDNNIFTLGPSLPHAGAHPLNFTPGDSTDSGHKLLDGLLSKAVQVPLS